MLHGFAFRASVKCPECQTGIAVQRIVVSETCDEPVDTLDAIPRVDLVAGRKPALLVGVRGIDALMKRHPPRELEAILLRDGESSSSLDRRLLAKRFDRGRFVGGVPITQPG